MQLKVPKLHVVPLRQAAHNLDASRLVALLHRVDLSLVARKVPIVSLRVTP